MDTLTAYVLFISSLVLLLFALKKSIPRLICWQLSKRYGIRFNVETVGLFNLTGLQVSLPADTNLVSDGKLPLIPNN